MITEFKLFEYNIFKNWRYEDNFRDIDTDDELLKIKDINTVRSSYKISLLMFVVSHIYSLKKDITRDGLYKFLDKHPDWNHLDINDNDFFDYCPSDYKKEIIERYPEDYKNYLINKDLEKFNI